MFGYSGETPLLLAVREGSEELVRLCFKHGADVFARNRYGENVLHVAAMHGNNELVKLFLDHGVDVNSQTADGKFPLYLAASHLEIDDVPKRLAVLITLVKSGANINLRAFKARTALHAICEKSAMYPRLAGSFVGSWFGEYFESVIWLLLSAGADVLAEDSDGKTPFALFSPGEDHSEQLLGIRLLIKALAMRKARQPSIELKDQRFIEKHPKLRDYYRECTEEIDRMKSTNFIETCTFFQLLSKNYRQIAAFMRNPEFEPKFKLYDLNEFSIYEEDIVEAFERAKKHYHLMVEPENVINEALYGMLPYVVVRRIVHYISSSSTKSSSTFHFSPRRLTHCGFHYEYD